MKRFWLLIPATAMVGVFSCLLSWADDSSVFLPSTPVPADSSADPNTGDDKLTMPTPGQIDPPTESVEPFVKPSEVELRKRLSRLQFKVTQEDATEPARKNRYWNKRQAGVYECIVCGQDLFTSTTKFKSGTGWPSFYAPMSEKQVGYKTDRYLFYPRTEVHCSRCKAHLGHVFNDGPAPTGKRYCMNSASLNFIEADK